MPRWQPYVRAAWLMAAVSVTGLAFGAEGQPQTEEEAVDYVALAAKLIADGHYDRAETMLGLVDRSLEGVDEKRFYTLKGLVYLKRQAFKEATESLQRAVRAGQQEPVVHVYLAQGYFGLGEYAQTIRELDRAGDAGKQSASAFGMRAQAHWEQSQAGQALGALLEGERRFPRADELVRARIFYLIDLGLYQEVLAASSGYLGRKGAAEIDYLAIGEALRRGGQYEKSKQVLEAARLRFSRSEKVAVQLAHAYVGTGQPAAAAMLFEVAARQDPKFSLEAAELYKEAGRVSLALLLNARVVDQRDKMKQRLSVLLSQERYEMILGMEETLARLGLVADDNVRYALAYARYKTGEFDAAEAHLRRITDSGLFRAGIQLRRAMSTCRESEWECF